MTKLNVRPSKPASIGALIVICFMLLFGIAFAIVVGKEIVGNEAEPALSVVFILFMIAWLGTAVFMLVYHILNIKRAKGLSLVDIEAEPGSQTDETVNDPMQKLRSLEALKKDGLISEDEFRRKREEIMQQTW
ncbi:MAG TPA: SHOCT domain-containing protein [Terracidiphilus sp.]